MGQARETLNDRLDGLRRGRFRRVITAAIPSAWLLLGAFAAMRKVSLIPSAIAMALLLAIAVTAIGLALRRRSAQLDMRGRWAFERMAAAAEVAESEGRDILSVPPTAARLTHGEVRHLDAALGLYQAAVGAPVYPRLERLPQSMYGERVDACARLEDGETVLCFTPRMLETFDGPMLLAVIAHLMARAEHLGDAGSSVSDGVVEADTETLLLTRDHVALLRALEAARVGPAPLAVPGDREAWFSEDEAVPRRRDEHARVEAWKRIDRLAELRSHLGALSLDVEEAQAEVRLARLFDVGSGELTPLARDALHES